MGKTHMMIGAAVGAMVEAHAPGIGVLEGMAVGAFGGLLPDLDHPSSELSQKVVPIAIGNRKISLALMALGTLYLGWKGVLPLHSVVLIAIYVLITAFAKHRGITHSLIGVALATFAMQEWLGTLTMAFTYAYASHLVADALTHGGVPFLWPIKKNFHVPTGLSTGHKITKLVERLFQLGSFACMCYLVVVHMVPILDLLPNIGMLQKLHI